MPDASTPTPRTLLLVWSSADLAAMHPHIDAGRMPNLRSLIERGTLTGLASPEPLQCEPLHASLATGLLADRHDVLAHTQLRADHGGIEAAGHRSWRAPALWEHLEAAGIRTACIDWPATFPADRWPGIHVDQRFAEPHGDGFETWAVPPGAATPAHLAPHLTGLRVHPADPLFAAIEAFVPTLATIDQAAETRIATLGEALARTATVHATATYVAQHAQWDVMCVCHDLLHRTRLAFPAEPPASRFADVIPQAHIFLDMMLGRMIELAGPAASVFVVSPNALSPRPAIASRPRPGVSWSPQGPASPPTPCCPAPASSMSPPHCWPATASRHPATAPPSNSSSSRAPRATTSPPPHPVPQTPPSPTRPSPTPPTSSARWATSTPSPPASTPRSAPCQADRARNLGAALMARGNLAAAALQLEAALAHDPDDVDALCRLARCRALNGEYEACQPIAARLLAIDPALPWGHLVTAAWCALAPGADDPDPHLARARTLGAANAEVLARIGGLELLRTNHAAAAADFDAALALDPDLVEASYGLAVARAGQGDGPAAEEAIRRAIRLEHNQPLAHHQLGVILGRAGRWREAVAALETARAQAPALPGIDGALYQARTRLAHTLAAGATPPHIPR